MKEFGGALRNMGYSNSQLAIMFYCICVTVRLLLAYSVFLYATQTKVLYAIIIIGLFAISTITKGMLSGKPVWWYREFHLFIAVMIVVVASVSLFSPEIGRNVFCKLLTGLLVLDVSFGVVISIIKRPFSK